MTAANSPIVCGICSPASSHADFTSAVIFSGARNLASLTSTKDLIVSFDASAQISPNPISGALSFFTDCIIHNPMIFFR